ncbi:MAG: hypothetical protein JXC31_05990 [Acholeplasmataceae bacterium]|nr:hypothetical protein [Acholeplasmataceae bacterium]
MSNIARKLVLSVVAVLLSVVAFGTTTFAWFTITNVSEVQSFQSDVVTDNGIEVSLDGTTWVTSLSTEMIETYIAAQYPSGFAFNHVTTATGYSAFSTLGTLGVTDDGTASVLRINILFRSNNANAIEWTGVSLSGTSVSWVSDVAFQRTSAVVGGTAVTSGSSISVNPANAMRISLLGNHASDTAFVYELPSGDNNGAYNTALGGDGSTPVDFSDGVAADQGDAGSYNYYYVKTGALITGTNAVVTAPTITAVDDASNARLVLNMTENSLYDTTYWGQVSIRIWFEGWDAEAYNSLLGRMITTSFTFEGTSI